MHPPPNPYAVSRHAPKVVLEAKYGWYWAADVLAESGASVHLAHPLGVKGFAYRRVMLEALPGGADPTTWLEPVSDQRYHKANQP
jgi:hypothetical protein